MTEATLIIKANDEGITNFDVAKSICLMIAEDRNGLDPIAIASMIMAEVEANKRMRERLYPNAR